MALLAPSNFFGGVVFDDDVFDMFGPLVSKNKAGACAKRCGPRAHVPRVNVTETEDKFTATADLAGIPKEQIKLEVEGAIFKLSSEHEDKREEEDEGKVIRRERQYRSFSRAVHLPAEVDASGVKAEFKDGLLTVDLPKAEAAKKKSITIN